MNALLDYGTSSSSSSDECDETEESTTEIPKQKLPKPSLGESTIQTSVFSNPFVAAEQAKAAILEKHVKMVPGKDGMQTINGRKICWNHRKGRCRFGHNCKYAHDTDIQKTPEELEAEKQQYKSVIFEGAGTMTAAPPPEATLDPVSNTDDVIWEGGVNKKKLKRPGLSKNLIPNKKVIKMYKEQKARDGKKI